MVNSLFLKPKQIMIIKDALFMILDILFNRLLFLNR
jgi:hypothetical protein